MEKKLRRFFSVILALALVVGSVQWQATQSEAAKKATLKTKKITVTVGNSKKIGLKNKKKKATYKFASSKKKIASVSRKGVVKGKKAGKAKITVKEIYKSGKKKKTRTVGKVNVTVKKKSNNSTKPSNTPAVVTSNTPTKAPTNAPTKTPSTVPSNTPATPSTEPSTEPSTAPAINEKYTELVSTSHPNYDRDAQGLVFDNADGSLWQNQYDTLVDLPIPATLEAGFTKAIFDISLYDASGNEVKYTDEDQYSGPITCDLFNEGWGLESPELLEGLWNYILDGISILDLEAETIAADFSGGTGFARVTIKDHETVNKVVIRSVRFSGYEGYDLPTKTDHSGSGVTILPEDVDVTGFYDTMVSDSLLDTGNNARIKAAIKKARDGEDVTIAYIGGSVTEGEGAKPNGKCYAEQSYLAFKETYGAGDGSNVHFVNAGMSGTPSSLGSIRYDRDVDGQAYSKPDVVFIEFAVNDGDDTTGGEAYESMIRDTLDSGAAVVLMFSVFKSKWNMQTTYKPIGEYYQLPMVSMSDAIVSHFKQNVQYWYFNDALHPNNYGYKLMSDCIMNMFDVIDKEAEETDERVIADIQPKKGDSYMGIKMLDSSVDLQNLPEGIHSLNAGSFSTKDNSTGNFYYKDKNGNTRAKFPDNWQHTTTSGSTSFTAEVTCSNMMLVYKLSNDATYGTAEILVDGEVVKTVSGYNSDGWNNAKTEVLFNEADAEQHSIEIRMAEGNENKAFTVLGFGYTKDAPAYGTTPEEMEPVPAGSLVYTPREAKTSNTWNASEVTFSNATNGINVVLPSQYNQCDLVLDEAVNLSQYSQVKVECEVMAGALALRLINAELDSDGAAQDVALQYNVSGTHTFDVTEFTESIGKIGIMANEAGTQAIIKRVVFIP